MSDRVFMRTGGDGRRRTMILLLVVAATLPIAACASALANRDGTGGSGRQGSGSGQGTGSSGTGPGISVDEALAYEGDEQVLVRGWLVVGADGKARLCTSLAESYPPQCGGSSIAVEGLDLDSVDGLKSEGGVSWSEDEVRLLGTVRDGILTVDEAATA